MACPIFEGLYEGTRGPGKTDSLLMDFAQFVGRGHGPAWRGILFRRHYPDLEEVEVKSKKWFHRIFPRAEYKSQAHRWVWPDGEELLFRYADKPDDYWNYHGHEFPWIGWDELTAWGDDELYTMMMSVCRSSDPNVPRRYRATCNPYGRGHNWVKARFIDPAPRGRIMLDEQDRERVAIHGSIYENLILLRNDPNYLANLKAQAGARRAAWLEGDWDIVAGGMFDDVWDGNVHVVAPFEIPATWHIDRSFDWGSAKPYSVGFWAESDGCDVPLPGGSVRSTQRGDLFRIGELYGWTGKPNEGTRELAVEVGRKIVNFQKVLNRPINPGPADSSIFSSENGNSIAGDMQQVGVRWLPSDKKAGSRTNGWELMRKHLKNAISREGSGLYVFDTCRQFIRTVPTLPRDTRNPDDLDTETEDHCLHGDTMVVTSHGNRPIRQLVDTVGMILTAGGYWTEYDNCRLTRRNSQVFRVTFEDDSFIICTGDHKILTATNQWQEARAWKSDVARNLTATFIRCTAQTIANQLIDVKQKLITSNANVPSAEETSQLVNTIQTKPAHGTAAASLGVKRVEHAGFSDVYCLNAHLTHCFVLGNGVIVHNCADESRYRILTKRRTLTVRQAS